MIPTDSSFKTTILCIDDDVSILRYEKALLERSGYEVLTALSGQQGLQLAIALRNLAGPHASRGESDLAMALCKRAYAAAPLPSAIGWLAGLLKRGGDTSATEALLRKLQPSETFGVSPTFGRLSLGPSEIQRAGGLAGEGDRPARSLQCCISEDLLRKGAALHSALGEVDAQTQSAGIVITAPPFPRAEFLAHSRECCRRSPGWSADRRLSRNGFLGTARAIRFPSNGCKEARYPHACAATEELEKTDAEELDRNNSRIGS